jgi:RHS repeat-associated protein
MKIGIENDFWTAEYYEATVVSANDYYPFGSSMAGRKYNQGTYRYGFNGKEEDKEWGSQIIQDYGFRIYNPTIGKFLSVDPLTRSYPMLTPYQFAHNCPIWMIDIDGLEGTPANLSGKIVQYIPETNTFSAGSVLDGTGISVVSVTAQKPVQSNTDWWSIAQTVGEIAIGFTPAGIIVDVIDLGRAISAGDPIGIATAAVGFIPGVGDIAKAAINTGVAIKSAGKVAKGITESASKAASKIDEGDIPIFRGTTEGYQGSRARQITETTPVSTDPYVSSCYCTQGETAAKMAGESNPKPIVLIDTKKSIEQKGVEITSDRSSLPEDKELVAYTTPANYEKLAAFSISLSDARSILKEMGYTVPQSLRSPSDLQMKLKEHLENGGMSQENIKEFYRRAAELSNNNNNGGQ